MDRVSLVAGIAIAAMGTALLLDQEDVIALSLGLVGAIVAAVIGTVLVVSGLGEERGDRGH